MKVNIKKYRKCQDYIEKIYRETNLGFFCRSCGESKPKNGMYPMSSGPGLTPYVCNDCMEAGRPGIDE